MSCIHNVLIPNVRYGTPIKGLDMTCSLSQVSFVQMPTLRTIPTLKLQHHKIPTIVSSSSKNKICAPTCFFGGSRNSKGENKAFSLDYLKDFVKGFSQKKEAQDILRDQIRQREFGGDDGNDNPPRNRGGGSDGNEDEGFASILDETVQVVLATIAFIFVYIYIIRGQELVMLARDYIKYLFGGVPSMRLQQTMDKWRNVLSKFSYMDEPCEDWLERLIVTTPTWWYSPEEVVQAVKQRRRRGHGQN